MSYGTVQAEKVTTESGYSLGAGNATSFKNKLINGAMAVNQYGSSAVSLGSSTTPRAFDRFLAENGSYSSNNGTIQQVSISNTFGFSSAGRVTAPTSYTESNSTAWLAFSQRIEGFNLQDLAYGSSAAKSVTLSFWVFSSLTGQYTLNLTHYDGTTERWIQNTYTITTANTWQFVSVTFSGDTSFGITNDNGATGWMRVYWNLGGGSAITGGSNPTNTWANASSYGGFRQQAGSVNFNNTSGATWQITGAQLEVGTVATSFDFRSYGTELALCQRYCFAQSTTQAGAPAAYYNFGASAGSASTTAFGMIRFPVTMRSSPSLSITAGNTFFCDPGITNWTSVVIDQISPNNGALTFSGGSGMTAGYSGRLLANNTATASMIWSAEL